ncbi:Outer membrane protein OmpA [Nocardiopsis flavescens]|uniref:Outer membrane protein OmpA n=1 Tax=Nocardiopsis flavescens TaxID=758803 RepID=A0A1M6B647_9ACTN|nr:OmpA family protein [Nocardiopsis flavescens]SHI44212.1 Outer membrane protein OmpA [Nocardiopsis flavescens]
MTARVPATTCAAAALSLLLTSCGIIPGPGGDGGGPDPSPSPGGAAPAHRELPLTRQGRMSVDGGGDPLLEVTFRRLQDDGEYLMLEVDHDLLEPPRTGGTVTDRTAPVRLLDPVSGEVLRAIEDPASGVSLGTYFTEGSDITPLHPGVPLTFRRYFPSPAHGAERLTFTGAGLGHVPGLPVERVDAFTPAPEPDVHDYFNEYAERTADELPEELHYPEQVPEPGLDVSAFRQGLEGFVDTPESSTARSGDTETISLSADPMFEGRTAEPTREGLRTLRRAALTLREGPREVAVVGHTDDSGAPSGDDDLSLRRAEAVRDALAGELGEGFALTAEGRGSREPVAEQGGADDEQARGRNRRVDLVRTVPDPDAAAPAGGLDSAARHTAGPAVFSGDPEPVGTLAHGDAELHVYPLVRDGAYLFQTLGFANSTLADLEPGTGAGEGGPGLPDRVGGGSLAGLRLRGPDGPDRYAVRLLTGQGREDFTDAVPVLSPGDEYPALAVFPAPGEDVSSMTLHAGVFGEIPDVPIR